MGYESRIYIVSKKGVDYFGDGNGKQYAEVIATMNMCKMGFRFESLWSKETDCFIYADDGESPILKDKYGDNLKECSIESLEEYLQHEIEIGDDYRRLLPLLSLVRAFKDQKEQWEDENIVALHYGY